MPRTEPHTEETKEKIRAKALEREARKRAARGKVDELLLAKVAARHKEDV